MFFKTGLASVSERVCFIADEFYLLLTWVGQELGFFSELSKFNLVEEFLLCHLIINKSNLLAVIVFHQSATGDTRGNFDFAVRRQNCAVHGRVYVYTWCIQI